MEHETGIVDSSSTLRFPFLGSQLDGETFQYLLDSISSTQAEISIHDWFIKREILMPNESVYLYIPEILTKDHRIRNSSVGIVTVSERDENTLVDKYKIMFSAPLNIKEDVLTFYQYANKLVTSSSLRDLLLNLLKDSTLSKLGIGIYLKHLGPYFSRIAEYSKEQYLDIKSVLLNDIESKVKEHAEKLLILYNTLEKKMQSGEDIPEYLNLEELRDLVESELSFLLLRTVFKVVPTDENSKLGETTFNYRKENLIITYIQAIKELERRLYSNYNQIVLMYVKSIKL